MDEAQRAELQNLVDEADRQGLSDPVIDQARQVLSTLAMEDAIASTMSGFGVQGVEWAEEDGTVTNSLEWDEQGKVKR